jgi:uroporphyrinogen decarboxylase
VDEWCVERKWVPADFGGGNWEKISYPLAGASSDDLDRFPWPDPQDPARVAGLEQQVRDWATNTDYALSARAVSHGLLETAQELRGLEAFLVDMMTDKAFAHKLFEKILNVQIGLYTALLKAVGPYLQIVTTADDYGSQRGPLISPRLYREMIMPYRQELNRHIRSLAPQVKIQHHTCGSVYKLLPALIESGIDIINPVQPLAADMEPARLKAEFGTQLVFHGAIDIQQAMNGSVQDVEAEVARRIEALAPGGGYIIAPCSNFQADNPPENILAMIAAARRFGKYPIQVQKT